MHRTLITAIGLFLVSAQLKAAESPQVLADQFVTLLRYEEQYFKYREQCIATQRTVSPSALVAKNPDYFGGIRPGQKNWQVLVAAYEDYFQEACSRPSKSEFLGALSASYAKALSTQQLKAAIAFYSSPTGLALIFCASDGNSCRLRNVDLNQWQASHRGHWAAAGSIDTDLSFLSLLELYGT